MYIVTQDKALLRAAAKTKTLLPLPTLDEFLQTIVQAQDPKIVGHVQQLLDSSAWDKIEETIREKVSGLGTVYRGDLNDGEVIEHEAGDGAPELLEFHVISVSDKEIEVVAKVKTPISFQVQYLDTDYAVHDKEDDTWIGAETAVATFDTEANISVLIVIDSEDDEITDITILTRDLNLSEPYEDYK
jgi:hypothetical protein